MRVCPAFRPDDNSTRWIKLTAGARDPFVRLHARDQGGWARAAGLVDERLAFADIGKLLSESVRDVGLVRHRQIIDAGFWRRIDEVAHGASYLGVLAVGDRHRRCAAGAAVGQFIHRRHVLAAKQLAGLDRTVEPAGVDFADRHSQFLERHPKLARELAALFAQLALRAHVVELEGVDILLAVVGGAVPKHDDVTTVLERRYETVQISRAALRRHQQKNDPTRNNGRKPVHGRLRLKKCGPKPDSIGKFRQTTSARVPLPAVEKRYQKGVGSVTDEFNPIQSVSIAPTSASATTLPFTLASP